MTDIAIIQAAVAIPLACILSGWIVIRFPHRLGWAVRALEWVEWVVVGERGKAEGK